MSPKCEEIRCDAPSLPENGSAIYLGNDRSLVEQSFSVGVTVQYNCDYGHIVQGPWANRQCQANGEWSGEAPTCRFVDCGQPSGVEFAQVTLKYPVANQNLVQGSRLPNLNDGGQSIPLNNYELMTRAGPPTYYGCVAHYVCEPNYRLSGMSIGSTAQRECLESGQWRKPAPTCEPIQCPRPDILDEHTLVEIQLVSGANNSNQVTAAVTTAPSTISGSTGNGSVSNNNQQQLVNQRALLASRQFGVQDKISYSCAMGYELYGGPEVRTCTHHGQWSGSSTPRCRLIDCGRPPAINPETGRYYLLNDTTTFNSLVEYTCIRPFKLIERSTTNGISRQDSEPSTIGNNNIAFGLKICSQTGQWWPSDLVPKCVGADLSEFNGGDNSVDTSNRNNQQVLAPNMAQDIINTVGGSSYRTNHHHHLSSTSSSLLWPNIIIGFGLFVMLILIVATLICIKTKRAHSSNRSQPSSSSSLSSGAITNNGQHHMGVVGVMSNGQHHLNTDVNGVLNHMLNGVGATNNTTTNGHHQQQQQQQSGKGIIDVSQHYINQQMMGTIHSNHHLYHHNHHLLGTTGSGGGGGGIATNGGAVVGLTDHSLHYASSPALLSMAHTHLTGHNGNGQPLHELPPNMRLPISGQAIMNALSTQSGGSQLGTPGSNSSSAISMATASTGSVGVDDQHHQQQQQQKMRSNRASAMMTYSRLSIESDGVTVTGGANNNNNNHSGPINGGHPLNTAHSIRHNPNGLITFVSPAQQQQHHPSNNNSKQPVAIPSANQISPHSAQTSLSISSASSPASSSSSSNHQQQQQQQQRERSLSNRLSSASMLAAATASGQLQISRSQFQAPRSPSEGSPQPPSLPAHPPPPHRLHHHQQQLMKQQQQQQSQRQPQATINQSSQQQQQQQQHHYMEPTV